MAVFIDNKIIMPIHGKEKPNICTFCSNPVAKWLVRLTSNSEPWCARCFLYETTWGKNNSSDIEKLVLDVGVEVGSDLREVDGRLNIYNSDRILSSIVFISALKSTRSNAENNRT